MLEVELVTDLPERCYRGIGMLKHDHHLGSNLGVVPSAHSHPVRDSDFAELRGDVCKALSAWLNTARSAEDRASPIWKNTQKQILALGDSVTKRDGMLFGIIKWSRSSRDKVNQALRLRPLFTDPSDKHRIIQVIHTEDEAVRKAKGGESECQFVWVRAKSVPDVTPDAATDSSILCVSDLRFLRPQELREGMFKTCRLTGMDLDENLRRRAMNAAIRARLLKFDADDIDVAAPASRKSEFSEGDESKMDAALVALFLRMEKWDYCHRVLVRRGYMATLGYVSAGPLEPGKSEPSALFKQHADNFVWDDLCWKKPVDVNTHVVLCFSGFRLHPMLAGLDGVGTLIVRAASEVCKDFEQDGWPIKEVLLSVHQPTARAALAELPGKAIGEVTDDFVRWTTTKLHQLAMGEPNSSKQIV
jgi:hypothetical protein